MDRSVLHGISLAAAREHAVEQALLRITAALAEYQGMALARIWLLGPDNSCSICLHRGADTGAQALHLVASDGRSLNGGEVWQRLDGDFHRFPLDSPRVGHVAVSGGPVLHQIMGTKENDWPKRPEWVRREQISSFAAQPLKIGSETLGVVAVFSRRRLDQDDLAELGYAAELWCVAVHNSRAFTALEQENTYLREEIASFKAPAGIIGNSPALREVLEQARLVAETRATVLLLGETGTGKELFAHAIHALGDRQNQPLVKVNAGAIPHALFESEFFGHVKGAFTGATKDRVGRFQIADGGTLFLDEVGEIPIDLQSKLLRALQDGTFERLGEDKTIRVNVRFIAATNRDLRAEVAAGRFREDLFFRLNTFPIHIPPLRDRPEDIEPLAQNFAERARRELARPHFRLTERDLQAIRQYPWPGNVRELASTIERAAILSAGPIRMDLASLLPPVPSKTPKAAGIPANPTLLRTAAPLPFMSEAEMREREKKNLLAVLEYTGWRIHGPGGAAEHLGVKPTTLASRLRALGIRRPK